MTLPSDRCQSCRRAASPEAATYRKGEARVVHDALLQCDICERFLCGDCLEVYDILSGDDFVCRECAGAVALARADQARLRPPR